MAEVERVTISLSKGFTEMLRAEFPHQTLSASISLLCEMAIDAELVCSRSKLAAFNTIRKTLILPPKPVLANEIVGESFGE